MNPTILNKKDFLIEVKKWGVTGNQRTKIRAMNKGEYNYFRYTIPTSGEIIETVIPTEEYENFDKVEFGPLIVPAVWEDDSELLKKIIEKLEVLDAKLTTSNRDNSLRSEFEFT